MAIAIKNSDLEILAQNGISTDDVRQAIPVLRKRGLSDEEIYNKIQTKIASLSTQKEEKPVAENTQKEKDYSATRAFINRAADAYVFGLGDKLAGLAATGVGQALQRAVNPIKAVNDPLQVSELDPRKYAEQYKQGRERFIEEQERFESENPAVAGAAEAVGTLVGFVGPKGFVNVGAKIAKPVMKVLPKASTTVGRLGKKVVATAAGESVALGAQGTLQGLGGVGSSRGGIEEAYERGKENLLIGAMGGGLGRAKVSLHKPLTNIALKRVAQNKTIANLVAGGSLSVADGTLMALGTNAVTNTENTTGNFLTNILFSGVGSAGAWGISKGLGKGRKLVTEPSDAKKAEIAENVEAFNKAKKIEEEIATTERVAEKGAKRLEKVQKQLQTSKKSLQVERENEAFYNREIKSLRNERRKLNKELRKTAAQESVQKETSVKILTDKIKLNETKYKQMKSQLLKTQERIMKGKGNRDALRQQAKDLREGLKENRKTRGLLEAERNDLLFPKKSKTVDITVSQQEIDTLRKQDPSINSDLVAKDLIVEQKIRETAKKQEKPSFRDRLVARTEEVRTVFDDLRPIKRAEELAGVSDYNQRGSNTIEKFRSGGNQEANLQPLADELERQSKISSTAVNKASRAASLEKKNQFLELGNKLTPEEEQLLKAYRSDETIKPILEQANNVRKKTLDNLLASGRIDKKTHDEWMKRDKYVPTTAEDVYGELTEDYRTNTNLQNRFKKYTGSVELEKNTIVETMVLNSQSERILAYQQAAKQYVNAAEKIGEAHRATNIPTWTPGQPVKYNRESQIVLWKNGVPEVWDVPTSIAKIFNPAPIKTHSKFITGVLNVLGGQMKLFKGTTTATSLGFSVVNPSRDIQSAVGGSKYGYLITNTDAINSYKEVIQAKSPLYKAFKKEFGSSTKINVESLPKTAEDNINRALNLAKGIEKAGKEDSVSGAARQMLSQALIGKASKLKGFSGKAMNGFLEGMTYAGNKGEEATRFAVFNSVLEGRAPNEKVLQMWRENPRTIPHNVMAEAGREAREVTLNFRRQMHPAIEAANKYVSPYLKPAILGTIRAWDALTNPEIAPKTWNFIDTIGRMQAMLNINAVKDIEQMQEFENINNEILGKNFVFRAKGGGYYSIPLSQEFAPLVKLSSNMYESIYRGLTGQYREDLLRETGVDVKELAKNMTPGIGYITETSNLIPGFAKPFVELAINKDFYSKTPIESEAQKMKPASRRYTQSTPRYLVKIASELSKYGVEVSPLQMHHVTKKIFSSTGREAGEAIDAALDSLDLLDLSVRKDIKDNPVIRRFVVNAFTAYSQTALDARSIIEDTKEYYKYMQKPDINLTDEQIDRFSKKSAVYASIKKLEQALQQNYSTRNKVYYGLANAGNDLKLRYKKGQITKEDYETQKLNLISQNSDYIEILKQQALRIEQQIIDVSKKVEKELNKKSPR